MPNANFNDKHFWGVDGDKMSVIDNHFRSADGYGSEGNKHYTNPNFWPRWIEKYIPYSRKQKYVSISDTPMLLIEINSISNMECQK